MRRGIDAVLGATSSLEMYSKKNEIFSTNFQNSRFSSTHSSNSIFFTNFRNSITQAIAARRGIDAVLGAMGVHGSLHPHPETGI